MNRRNHHRRYMLVFSALLAGLLLATTALAQFEIARFTIDSGGGTSSGGGFDLSGTIGQADAGTMSDGTLILNGGFWTPAECTCLSDVNSDGLIDGLDIQGFVDCLVGVGALCECADRFTDGVLDINDVPDFVDDLLTGAICGL
ncbi:MAG: hypothetical protein MI923_13700 [Phycisphaerales bacterium]|nr:hypothetical protein [Phycisphaerales bacterium]